MGEGARLVRRSLGEGGRAGEGLCFRKLPLTNHRPLGRIDSIEPAPDWRGMALMKLPVQESGRGWQPLTPRGVAALALGSLRRLLLVQSVFAGLTAAAAVWFLSTTWFPPIRAGIQRLPDHGEIRSARLACDAPSPQLLGENGYLCFILDLNHTGQLRSPALVQVEFGKVTIRMISLFGYMDIGYPRHRVIPFNRGELEPWWGAWEPPILWIAFVCVLAGLMVLWCSLATLFSGGVWLMAFFANRDLNLWQSWKLAGAAFMPGALFLIAGLLLSGAGILDLVQGMAFAAAQFLVAAVYGVLGVLFAPRLRSPGAAGPNPFSAQ